MLISSTPTAGSDPTHEVVAEQSRDEKLSLIATDVVREILWQKIPRVRKVSSVPTREEITKCHSLSERSQFVRCVRSRKQQKHDPSVEENQRSAWMGLYLLQNSATWSRQITTLLNVENESRCGRKDALIVQDELTNWIQSYPMKIKKTSETMSCLQGFTPPSRKPEVSHTDNSKYLILWYNALTSTWSRSTTSRPEQRTTLSENFLRLSADRADNNGEAWLQQGTFFAGDLPGLESQWSATMTELHWPTTLLRRSIPKRSVLI